MSEGHPHHDSGRTCLISHYNEGFCIRCDQCGQLVRPSKMLEECGGFLEDGAEEYQGGRKLLYRTKGR